MGLQFRGKHETILHDTTAEIDVEGGLNSGKTILCLTKELRAAQKWAGIWVLIARWTDEAVRTLLRPPFEQVARIEGVSVAWNEKEHYYALENGSRIYAFGLKTQSQDPEQRYGKIRGFAGSRIYIDQAEQLPKDIAEELRARLRPDIEASHKGITYPTQLTFSPNPTNDGTWLATQFPIRNTIKGRRYYALSLFDNQHNLSQDSIDSILRTYPPEHPKHQTVVLGQRGLNVIGDAIYEMQFDRKAHVRELVLRDDMPCIEALEVGKHNPVWLLAQRSFHGGLNFLGGIIGRRMMLDDFLPVVKRYRGDWIPTGAELKTCSGPMGISTSGYTLMNQLQAGGFRPIWRPDGNAPDVQLAMIEYIGGELRRRTVAREEAIGISNDASRWLSIDPRDGSVREVPFLAFAFEGGYVYDSHTLSVGNKEIRQPYADDEYANAMRCVEHIALNFCAGMPTDAEQRERERRMRAEMAVEGPSAGLGLHGWMST